MNDSVVIRAEQLGKTYAEGKLHTPVFDGLELAVHAGETIAILGASGAGKSTLLHLLGGLDTPTSGEVYVAGQKMSALSRAIAQPRVGVCVSIPPFIAGIYRAGKCDAAIVAAKDCAARGGHAGEAVIGSGWFGESVGA